MLRLGSRADRKRMSSPPERATSRPSPESVETATGTSWMFSLRRWAVTMTSPSVAFGVSWAQAEGNCSAMAMAAASDALRISGTPQVECGGV